MIAVDTSALMAIVRSEADASACITAINSTDEIILSAATAAEALIVARRRNLGAEMEMLLAHTGFTVLEVTAAIAQRVADAYDKWGKGVHPAALNFGDCFAYETAKSHNCPLLYIGNDFAQTDVQSAL